MSRNAKRVMAVGQRLGMKYWGDVNWSIAEASTRETPTGEVHLHWKSHRGIGNWNIVTNPKWRGEICGTPRCRRVIIEPLGGENESANLGDKTIDEVMEEWLWAKPGAACYLPRDEGFPPYVHITPTWQTDPYVKRLARAEFLEELRK